MGGSLGGQTENPAMFIQAKRSKRGIIPPSQQRPGVTVSTDKPVRESESQSEGSISPHRQATNASSTAIRSSWEISFDEIWQLPAEKFGVGWAINMIRVEVATTVRHDNDQRQIPHIPFNARAPLPGRVVIGQAVQQIERGERTRTGLRQNDIHADRFFEQWAIPMYFRKRHVGDHMRFGRVYKQDGCVTVPAYPISPSPGTPGGGLGWGKSAEPRQFIEKDPHPSLPRSTRRGDNTRRSCHAPKQDYMLAEMMAFRVGFTVVQEGGNRHLREFTSPFGRRNRL